MARRSALVALILALGALATGCGGSDVTLPGFPAYTKNTTRIGSADAATNAAAVARAVYTSRSLVTRPQAVTVVDRRDWRAAIAASLLMSPPIRAPLLYSDGKGLSATTRATLDQLAPRGARIAGGAQILRVGDAAKPKGFRRRDISGANPFALARAIDAFHAGLTGQASDRVVIVSADDPAFAMPAAGYAAKSGDPVLFVRRDRLPPETRAALLTHQRPRIYVLGPASTVSDRVLGELRKLGIVTRIAGPDPVRNAIEFARFSDGEFGWGIRDPGHGFVFANASRPLDAGAAAPLSASGTYGPLLLLSGPNGLTRPLEGYLLDIQSGYEGDPSRYVYNRGWLIGDGSAISPDAQSKIDALLEIVPVDRSAAP